MKNSEHRNGQGCGTFVLFGRFSGDLRPKSVVLECCMVMKAPFTRPLN